MGVVATKVVANYEALSAVHCRIRASLVVVVVAVAFAARVLTCVIMCVVSG